MIVLPDIANTAKPVPIRGVDIQPRGLGMHDLIELMTETPSLRKAFDGSGKTSLLDVVAASRPLLIGFISRGTGIDPTSVATLEAHEEALLLAPIIENTMRAGIGPFVQLMNSIAKAIGGEDADPATTLKDVDEKLRAKIRARATRGMDSSSNASPSSTEDSPTVQ
jgi:hypothetical protein